MDILKKGTPAFYEDLDARSVHLVRLAAVVRPEDRWTRIVLVAQNREISVMVEDLYRYTPPLLRTYEELKEVRARIAVLRQQKERLEQELTRERLVYKKGEPHKAKGGKE